MPNLYTITNTFKVLYMTPYLKGDKMKTEEILSKYKKIKATEELLDASKSIGDSLTTAFTLVVFTLTLVAMRTEIYQVSGEMNIAVYGLPVAIALIAIVALLVVKVEGAESSTSIKLLMAVLAISPSVLFYGNHGTWSGFVIGVPIIIVVIMTWIDFEKEIDFLNYEALVSDTTKELATKYHNVASSVTLMLTMLIMTNSAVMAILALGIIPALPYVRNQIRDGEDTYEME